eukprot:2252008-Pleurochrysis_carterae.AAC.1
MRTRRSCARASSVHTRAVHLPAACMRSQAVLVHASCKCARLSFACPHRACACSKYARVHSA